MGVDIIPYDIDIGVQEQDFYKIKELFFNYMVEPFVDNKGMYSWFPQYFGRLCINGVWKKSVFGILDLFGNPVGSLTSPAFFGLKS